MIRISDYSEPGDHLCVAWIESGSCHDAYFEIDALGSDSTEYDLKLSNDNREFQLHEGPAGLVVLVDPTVDDSRRAYPALGVSDCVHGLAWDIILSMLILDYSVEDAVDLAAIGFGLACPKHFSQIRDTSPNNLQARVDALIDMIENPAGTEVA